MKKLKKCMNNFVFCSFFRNSKDGVRCHATPLLVFSHCNSLYVHLSNRRNCLKNIFFSWYILFNHLTNLDHNAHSVWVTFYTGKNNGFPFLDIFGYLKNTHKNPKFGRVRQVPVWELGWEFPGWDLSHFAKFGIFMGIL